ncbi:MAG: hypothetical protein IIC94_07585 [Chloroflexi bacterium]|nr:hypothetical protein [Chloroflexota bacterium]
MDILHAYLTTEPYILKDPAPQVQFSEGELHLHFFALPTLSQAEHALLDSTVRRLRPREDEPTPGARTA